MASEDFHVLRAYSAKPAPAQVKDWRRSCGCIKTSDKLKEILMTFPKPPPPTPLLTRPITTTTCISACCHNHDRFAPHIDSLVAPLGKISNELKKSVEKPAKLRGVTSIANAGACYKGWSSQTGSDSWQLVAGLVSLVQLSVTATALALYYLIYCYMQLVYYTLKTALYFHHADGPMKITIAVMTLTSLVIGFNLLLRMERVMGIGY